MRMAIYITPISTHKQLMILRMLYGGLPHCHHGEIIEIPAPRHVCWDINPVSIIGLLDPLVIRHGN